MSDLAVNWEGEYTLYERPEDWLPRLETSRFSPWILGQMIFASHNEGSFRTRAFEKRLVAGSSMRLRLEGVTPLAPLAILSGRLDGDPLDLFGKVAVPYREELDALVSIPREAEGGTYVFLAQQWEPGGQSAYPGGRDLPLQRDLRGGATLRRCGRVLEILRALARRRRRGDPRKHQACARRAPLARARAPSPSLNYLVDTNIASYFMERRPAVVSKVGEAGGPGLLSISTISPAELTYGVRVMPEGRKRSRLLESLERILETGTDVRPFSADAARVYSEAGATLKGAGIAFEFPDLAIASIAIAENKTLASNDAFFEQIERLYGLSFERWEP